MPSEHLQLLLRSLRQCCDELQGLHDDFSTLSQHPQLSENWVKGITDKVYSISHDLRDWCLKFEYSNHGDNELQYCKKMESSDWIKVLSGDMRDLLHDASNPDITEDDGVTVLREIDQSLKLVVRQVNTVKELDCLAATNRAARKNVVRQDQREAQTMESLFRDRLRVITPEHRQRSFSYMERGCIGLEEMDWFWKRIPRPQGMENIRESDDRFDGVLIESASVERARAVLEMFINAWVWACGEPGDRPSLDSMQDMPAIACALYACGKQALFNRFITSEIKDSALGDDWATFRARVVDAVGKSDAPEVIAQFSRIRAKPWPVGTHLKLDVPEPLPLRKVKELREKRGPVEVSEVEDVWQPKTFYALKVVKTGAAQDEQIDRLVNEITQLTELSKEDHGHHIVKCVKTYERGGRSSEIGMVLLPVANYDLRKFLQRCCKNHVFRNKSKDHLLQAFGCLAFSLAYLHNIRDMRHRDMKPENILVHTPAGKTSPEFILADFGLALVFREQGWSGDANPSFGATPEYESPEVDPERLGMHTRAADVFALGCIFLELVWVLNIPLKSDIDGISLHRDYWNHNRQKYYKHHLPQLNDWINKTCDKLKNSSSSGKQLCALLSIAQKMIKPKQERLKIGQVVQELWKCKTTNDGGKPFCERCIHQMKFELNSKSPPIFVHVPSERDRVRVVVRPRPLGTGG